MSYNNVIKLIDDTGNPVSVGMIKLIPLDGGTKLDMVEIGTSTGFYKRNSVGETIPTGKYYIENADVTINTILHIGLSTDTIYHYHDDKNRRFNLNRLKPIVRRFPFFSPGK